MSAIQKSNTRTPAKHRSIANLYRDFENAEAAYKALPGSIDDKRFGQAVNKACRIARQIAKAPADSIEHMLLKIRVVAWYVGENHYQRLEELDRWTPDRFASGPEYDALVSLRTDLRRLKPSRTLAR
jgi:hypothetical protein